MHPYLNTAFTAVRKASKVILHGFDRLDLVKIDEKSRHNYVTDIDRQAEQIIVDGISKAYPSHAILAEESGEKAGNEITWIIDPLDGTTNFIHGYPHFAISIGVQVQGHIQHGLIYDPLRDELFTASRGEGASLNNRKIRVSPQISLNGAFLATGSPFRDEKQLNSYMKMLAALYPETAGIRRAGSAALDLAYVAAGRFDGFWEMGLQPWDIAAGSLLVTEAGGLVGDFQGDHHYLQSGRVVAGAPKIFKQILQVIQPYADK